MSARPVLFLAGLFLCCRLFLRAEAVSGSRSLLKMLHAKSMLQPLIMQMMQEGSLDGKVDHMLAQVPNKTCSGHLKAYIEGIKKMQIWALKMFDSSEKSPESLLSELRYHMGNYDECVNVKDVLTSSGTFSGQHCLARVCMSDTSTCTDRPREAWRKNLMIQKEYGPSGGALSDRAVLSKYVEVIRLVMIRIAVCVPSTCTAVDVEAFLNAAAAQVSSLVRINVVDQECHTAVEQQLVAVDYLTIVLLLFVVAVVVWSTAYDLRHQNPGDRNELCTAFSAYTNMKRLTDTSVDRDSLHCLHGIRFFSICWILLGHRFMHEISLPVTNSQDVIDIIISKRKLWIANTALSVDTFFVLSGLLLAYVVLGTMMDKTSFNLKAFYLHRYIRLTPALAIMVLLEFSLLTKLRDGPLWNKSQQNDCGRSWWFTLLYLKNYNMPSSCVGQSWYLSADMQLYWLSPLLLIPLWKNPRIGRRLLAVALFASWAIPFTQAYMEQLMPPMAWFSSNDRISQSSYRIYYTTHSRFAPWVLGLWLGYILHRFRIGQYKVQLNKVVVAVMWLFITFSMVGCICSIYPYMQADHEYSRFWDSLVNSLVHLTWGLAISLIIFACVTGYGGPVNALLSLGIWQPFSRLTYGIYLVHMSIQYTTTKNIRTAQFFSSSLSYYKFFADVVLSIIAATVMSLMFESPLIIIEKTILRKGSNKYALVSRHRETESLERKV